MANNDQVNEIMFVRKGTFGSFLPIQLLVSLVFRQVDVTWFY